MKTCPILKAVGIRYGPTSYYEDESILDCTEDACEWWEATGCGLKESTVEKSILDGE